MTEITIKINTENFIKPLKIDYCEECIFLDCYAVTRKTGSDLITGACYFDGIGNWYNDNQINHERNYLTNIVAWRKLPDPYTGESEG